MKAGNRYITLGVECKLQNFLPGLTMAVKALHSFEYIMVLYRYAYNKKETIKLTKN